MLLNDVNFIYFLYSRFATRQKNALMLYNGRYNDKHDFIAMEIIDSQLVVSFSLGANISKVSAKIPGGVSDGQWHEAELNYLNRVIKFFYTFIFFVFKYSNYFILIDKRFI